MAHGKTAELFQSSSAASSAHKAVDGNTSDAASSGACAQTTNSSHSWWKVDLGRPYLLTGMRIYNRERGGTFVGCLFVSFFLSVYVSVWGWLLCVYVRVCRRAGGCAFVRACAFACFFPSLANTSLEIVNNK